MNPFDSLTVLLAKHAQHVALIHLVELVDLLPRPSRATYFFPLPDGA